MTDGAIILVKTENCWDGQTCLNVRNRGREHGISKGGFVKKEEIYAK